MRGPGLSESLFASSFPCGSLTSLLVPFPTTNDHPAAHARTASVGCGQVGGGHAVSAKALGSRRELREPQQSRLLLLQLHPKGRFLGLGFDDEVSVLILDFVQGGLQELDMAVAVLELGLQEPDILVTGIRPPQRASHFRARPIQRLPQVYAFHGQSPCPRLASAVRRRLHF
eukprot:scaffold1960_cov242-Pinguiococcus_pyrenoidosus.AAC.11